MTAPNHFANVPKQRADAVYLTADLYAASKHPKKLNLGVGAYRDADAKPYVLNVVKKAETAYLDRLMNGKENKEYDAIGGFAPFNEASVKLLLGPDTPPMERVSAVSCLSGSGALRVLAELLAFACPKHTPVYISKETWPNHHAVFNQAGLHNIKSYRYYDDAKKNLNEDNMLTDLADAPEGAIVLFHAVGHNPTGCDPTQEMWRKLSLLSKRRNFRVIFDCAYQGYASGNLDTDAFAPRLFVRDGHQIMTAQSYAKNLGFYGERVGVLSIVCKDAKTAAAVSSFVKAKIIRPMYSSPPRRGTRLAHHILTDPVLRKEWEAELAGMAARIKKVRTALYNELVRLQTPGTWEHVIRQIGMFSYLGLTAEQCDRLIKEHHVFLLSTSRISLAGLTDSTVPYLAKAIDTVVRDAQKSKL